MSSAASFSDPAVLARRHAMASELKAIDISVLVVAILFVILRLWARTMSKAGCGWDDWLIIAASLVLFANLATNLIMIDNGLGMHVTELTKENLVMIGKGIYADEPTYVQNLSLVKLSILVMYCRIFSLRSFRIGAWVIGSITVAWSLMFNLLCIFQCTPVPKAWDPSIPGKCRNLKAIYVGNAIPNIVTDVVILCMPLYHVWALHMKFLQRATVSFIVSLGCFVIFASIYRMVLIVQLDQNDFSYSLKGPGTWSHIEICTAIVSACLPCMRPLLTSFLRAIGRDSSGSSKKKQPVLYTEPRSAPQRWKSPSYRNTIDPTLRKEFEELNDEEDHQWGMQKTEDMESIPLPPSKAITVVTRLDQHVEG